MEPVQSRLDCVVRNGHPSIYGYSNAKTQSNGWYKCYWISTNIQTCSVEPHFCLIMFLMAFFYFLILNNRVFRVVSGLKSAKHPLIL